jgi:uncharacterized membrane protein
VIKERLYFIDIVRAFAILMMLQGHFIDTLLDNSYRNLSSETFALWSFLRGITAPTFFTISGLIFTYLLLKAKDKGLASARMKKGILRGFFLIGIGYFIRMNLSNWFVGKIHPSFFATDVLHCIGLSLILTISVFYICNKKILLFSIVSLITGTLIFLFEPAYRTLHIEGMPIFIENYISKRNGSVFRIFPWYGYSSMGAFLATLFYWNLHKNNFKSRILISFVSIGLLLIFVSSDFLMLLFEISNIALFRDAANYNYLFSKLGYVLLYFAFFYGLESYLRYPTLLKIGKNTLSIYIIHFILLYGSFIGIGFKNIGRTLNPLEVFIGALLFALLVVLISIHYTKATQPVKQYIQAFYLRMKATKH